MSHKHNNLRINSEMEDEKKNQVSTENTDKKDNNQKNNASASSYSNNSNGQNQQKQQSVTLKETPITATVNMSQQASNKDTTVTPGGSKQLALLIQTYLDKVKEYEQTKSNSIKLWKYFWNIAQYVLESRSRKVMDEFFTKFVRTPELNNELYALRMIYEVRDQILRTKVSIFWQIHNQLKRFFAERGTCYISIRSVARTFDGFPEFADWVNLKKNR